MCCRFYQRNRAYSTMTSGALKYSGTNQRVIKRIVHGKCAGVMTMAAIDVNGVGIGMAVRLTDCRVNLAGMTTRARAIIGNISVTKTRRSKRVSGMTRITLVACR